MKYIVSILLILTHCALAFANSPPIKKFITIADIHFNPFIGCNPLPNPCPMIEELRTSNPESWDLVFQKYIANMQTQYHQNTNFILLQSALTELHQLTQQQHPAFILILGDFLAHSFPEQFKQYTHDESQTDYQAFTQKTLRYLTYKLNQAAPTTSFYPVLGNNDSYTGNYNTDPKGPFLIDTTDIFSALIKNENALNEFKQDYPNAGYYTVTLNPPNQRLIILNSILFSTLSSTPIQRKAAIEQLTWLQTQLHHARKNKQHVLIALHIPLGVDVFLSSKISFNFMRYFVNPLFFSSAFNKKIISLLQDYSDTVVGLLPAHTHHDNFQLIKTKDNQHFIPSVITASISPIYGNNPGLKIFSYNDKTFELINFDTYVYPLDKPKPLQWEKEYNFNDVYQPNCQQCTIVNGIRNLQKETTLINSYKKYFGESLSTPPANFSIINYWCAIYNTDWRSYKTCMSSIPIYGYTSQ